MLDVVQHTCQFKVNGTAIFDESTFSLTSTDGSNTDLAIIVEQDSKTQTCVIKANDKQQYGDVLLHVSNLNGLSKGHKNKNKIIVLGACLWVKVLFVLGSLKLKNLILV